MDHSLISEAALEYIDNPLTPKILLKQISVNDT
jgi:hypothetical protein